MNIEVFITQKLLKDKNKSSFSKNAVNIAVLSIALGLAVMIIAVAVVTGFKNEIAEKVIGFGAHIQITHFHSEFSLENKPIDKNQSFVKTIQAHDDIAHMQIFSKKPGIIKTDDHIQGVVVKGVGSDYNWTFFENRLTEGSRFTVNDSIRSNDIIISNAIAKLLSLNIGDKIQIWFIQDPPRVRLFEIIGLYETGLEEFDLKYVLIDIAHIQRLNNWSKNQIDGFEVFINDFSKLDEIDSFIYDEIGYDLYSQTIKELYPAIFDWLGLLDMNAIVILFIMLLVAAINMITTLLIIILERTNMIGILKTIGTTNFSIRKIFLYYASYILFKGLIWGNLLSISICLIQIYFAPISLPQESYFVSVVPINLSLLHIFIINLGTIICTLFLLLAPSYVISRITPVRAIKFD